MSLIKKYTLLFSAFGLAFIIASFSVFIVQFNHSSEDEIVTDIKHHLEIVSLNVEEIIKYEIDMAVYITGRFNLIELLLKDNEVYSALEADERISLIAGRNERWMNSSEEDALVRSIMENKLSDGLRSITNTLEGRYGEIFLTNKYGAVAGCTSKLTTFNHDYKNWWQKAYNDGKGKVFIDDRGYDDSAGTYVLGIVVPVYHNNEIIGILKCNVSMLNLLKKIRAYETALGRNWNLIMARSKGGIIYKNGIAPLSEVMPDEVLSFFSDQSISQVWVKTESGKSMYIHSTIPATYSNDKYDFGGTTQTIDHSMGNSDEHWCVYASISAGDLHARVSSYQRLFIILAIAFTIICIITAIIISHRLTRSIKRIIDGVNEIRKGNLDFSIIGVRNDETELIAESINNMAREFKKTLVSKDELQELVKEKQHLLVEFNHRVKNNLMLVSSLISLKETASESAVDFSDIKQQIEAVRLTHEMLMDSDDIYNINIKDYLEKLLKSIFRSVSRTIIMDLDVEVQEIDVSRAKTLGLIINEAATNTIKYSGHEKNSVIFSVKLKSTEAREYLLVIKNTGRPFPESTSLDNPGTLGLQLISSLVKQLNGSIHLDKSSHPVFTIKFPVSTEK